MAILLGGAPGQPAGNAPLAASEDLRLLHEEAIAALQRRELDRSVEIYGRILTAKPDDAIAHYNQACALALAGRTAQALDALERAIRAGYEEADHIDQDSDLASVRSQDRYRALLKDLRGRDSGVEIYWLPDLKAALAESRREDACVFLLFAANTPADRDFEARTLVNPDLRARLKDFASVRVDPSTQPSLAGADLPPTPIALVLDPQGRFLGALDPGLAPAAFALRLGELIAERPLEDQSPAALPPEVRRKLAEKHFPGLDPKDASIDASVELLRLPAAALREIGGWSWPRRNLKEFGGDKVFLLARTPDGRSRAILFRAGEWRKDVELTQERARVLRRLYAGEALAAGPDPRLQAWVAREDVDPAAVLEACVRTCAGRGDLPLDADTVERARKNLQASRGGGRVLAAALGALSESEHGADCAWAGVWLVSRMDRMAFMRTIRRKCAVDLERADAREFFENVLYAVKARRAFPWGPAVSPEDFLHFVLPPRGTQEPLQRWRRLFFEALEPEIRKLSLEDRDKAVEFATACCYDFYQYEGATPWEDFGMISALGTHEGRCEDCSNVECSMIRAIGIPAGHAYAPWWAAADGNHAWRMLPGITPRSRSNSNAKVFLSTWDGARDITELHAERLATISVETAAADGTPAALACWNSGAWRALTQVRVAGGKAVFEKVGCEQPYALNVRVRGERDRVLILGRDGSAMPVEDPPSPDPGPAALAYEAPKSGELGEFDAGQSYRMLVLSDGAWKDAPFDRASTGAVSFMADPGRLYRIEGQRVTTRPFRVLPGEDGSGARVVKY